MILTRQPTAVAGAAALRVRVTETSAQALPFLGRFGSRSDSLAPHILAGPDGMMAGQSGTAPIEVAVDYPVR